MIDGFRARHRHAKLHPGDKDIASKIVVGDHSKDVSHHPHSIAAAATAEKDQPQTGTTHTVPEPTKSKRSFKEWLRGITKKQWMIIGVVAAVLIGGGITTFLLVHKNAPEPKHVATVQAKPVVPPKPTTVPSTLTGLPVDPSVNQRTLTGVMIENSTFARPQSGLDQAGVVFEAVAEGGITRFLTLFQDTQPTYLGPVRSVRPYYIQWAMGFDAAIAHVGGSPEALNDMKALNVKDLDQFYNGGSYHRISSRDAPHNVYTSIGELNSLEIAKGYGPASFTGFERKAEQPSKIPTAKSIDFTISYSDYNVHYDYDATTNSYKRSEGGAPHMEIDQNGAQTQISPKVVIALVMNQGIEADDLHTSYATIGSGHMYLFQDGLEGEGTWQKTSNSAQFTFTDGNGKAMKFNPGQTWLTVVGSTSDVAYKP